MALPLLTADDCDRRADEIEQALSKAQVYTVADETTPRLLRTVSALLRRDAGHSEKCDADPVPFVVSETELQELHRLRDVVGGLRSVHQRGCPTMGCLVCGILDCPEMEPLHYDKDGCPVCSQEERSPLALRGPANRMRPFWLKSDDFERLDGQAIEAYAGVTPDRSPPWSGLNDRGRKSILSRVYGIGWDEAWKVSDRIVARLKSMLDLVHMVFEGVEFVPKDQAAVMEALRAWKRGEHAMLPSERSIRELKAQSQKETG